MAENQMTEVHLSDENENTFDSKNLFSIDTLTYINSAMKNMDYDFGTTDDPHFQEFKDFVDEVNNSKLEVIQLDTFEKDKFDSVDLVPDDGNQFILGIKHFFTVMTEANELMEDLGQNSANIFNIKKCEVEEEEHPGFLMSAGNTKGLLDVYKSQQIKKEFGIVLD